jgi:opacity protein-like surface antigen
MKKLLTTFFVFISYSSLAKTEGFSIGFDLLNTHSSSNQLSTIADEDQISSSVNLKHAFNWNGFYLAPGAFVDFTELSHTDSQGDEWDLDYRYGVNLDLGFDFNDKHSAFANIGYANNIYELNLRAQNSELEGSDATGFYGFGYKYNLDEFWDLRAAYEFFSFDMEFASNSQTQFDVDVLRIGAAYRF